VHVGRGGWGELWVSEKKTEQSKSEKEKKNSHVTLAHTKTHTYTHNNSMWNEGG